MPLTKLSTGSLAPSKRNWNVWQCPTSWSPSYNRNHNFGRNRNQSSCVKVYLQIICCKCKIMQVYIFIHINTTKHIICDDSHLQNEFFYAKCKTTVTAVPSGK